MGEVLNVFQYQPVLFTSTTTGAVPITLSWSFPGGSPLSGTGVSETVIYNSPGNYTVTLTATDKFGTTDFLTETNIIRVDPVTITPGINGPIPSTVKMSEGYDVYDDSTGNPYPAISWYWQLPYGVTASTEDVGVTGYIDWYTLTGTYSGDPGSSYIGNISLTVNNGFTPATATSTIEVQKLGPSETIGLNATGGIGIYPTQTGLSGGILVNPMIVSPIIPATLSDLGYPGTGATAYAFHVDLRTRTGLPVTTTLNQNFHSTNESALVQIKTGFYSDSYIGIPGAFDPLGGFLIVNSFVYSTYSTVPVNPGISSGQYIIQQQSYDFYLADVNPVTGVGGLLTEVYQNRNYSITLIDYLITNPYKLIFSGNLQFINQSSMTPMTFPYVSSFPVPVPLPSGGNNPAVYSPLYLSTIGASGGPLAVYEVYTSVTIGFTTFGATASFTGNPGGTGNDPLSSGNFFTAQDNSNGLGFVTYLNQSINASIPGGTGTIVYEAQPFFNCDYTSPTGGTYDPNNYYGVALKVIDKQLIRNVYITDNSALLSLPGGPTIAPFTADTVNSQGSTETCSGMFPIGQSMLYPQGLVVDASNPLQNNVLIVGGSIVY